MKDQSIIELLPKAELHVHVEGTLEPEMMFEMAKRNNIDIPYKNIDEVKQSYQFENLQSFLDIYYLGTKVLRTEQDFYELTLAYFEKCIQDHVIHCEIFFDPQSHLENGVSFETVINGITRARNEALKLWNISSFLIMCFLRHLSEKEAFNTLQLALLFKDKIIGVGLDSSELGHPPEKFESVFNKANEEGFVLVAHAGEEGPTDYVWQALDLLKVSRVDHGVQSSKDIELMQRLKNEQIPLTVCPLSNTKLKVFENLEEHNIKEMLDENVMVTVNSDDPAYFGGYINQNFIELAQALKLSNLDIAILCKNSFKASFLSHKEINDHCQKIDNIVESIGSK